MPVMFKCKQSHLYVDKVMKRHEDPFPHFKEGLCPQPQPECCECACRSRGSMDIKTFKNSFKKEAT